MPVGAAAPGAGPERPVPGARSALALLLVINLFNYLDRQVFSILAPDLQKEIGWSELEYGRIVIAFQVAYAAMMLVSGRIIDRIGTKLSF